MNTEQIISDWMSKKENIEKLPTVAYPEQVYNHIRRVSNVYSYLDIDDKKVKNVYNVEGVYQRVVLREYPEDYKQQ